MKRIHKYLAITLTFSLAAAFMIPVCAAEPAAVITAGFTETDYDAMITLGESATVWSEPGKDQKEIGTIAEGELVHISREWYDTEENVTWCYITCGEIAGWVMLSVLDSEGEEIILPADVSTDEVQFGQDGTISYTLANGNVVTRYFGIYQFNNPTGLEKRSDNLLAVTAASGNPLAELGNDNLTPSRVLNQYLEGSNVQVADEMVDLIVAQRAYELNSKAITAADEMMQQANQLR